MTYARCVNNSAYVHMPGGTGNGHLADLTIGAVYKVLPTSQDEHDMGSIRIIDNSGEDYLYPASYFQPLDWDNVSGEGEAGHAALTIHLDRRTKAILRAEALASHTSMGNWSVNGSRSGLKSEQARRPRVQQSTPIGDFRCLKPGPKV